MAFHCRMHSQSMARFQANMARAKLGFRRADVCIFLPSTGGRISAAWRGLRYSRYRTVLCHHMVHLCTFSTHPEPVAPKKGHERLRLELFESKTWKHVTYSPQVNKDLRIHKDTVSNRISPTSHLRVFRQKIQQCRAHCRTSQCAVCRMCTIGRSQVGWIMVDHLILYGSPQLCQLDQVSGIPKPFSNANVLTRLASMLFLLNHQSSGAGNCWKVVLPSQPGLISKCL